VYGVPVRPPSDHEFQKCIASPCNNRSRPKQPPAYSRAPICRLNCWCAPLLITLCFCALLALSGCGGLVVNSANAGSLLPQPSSVNFGAVSIGQTVSTTVSLLNGSSAPVEVTQLNLTGQSFSVGPSNLPVTIAAGGTYTLNVQFNPATIGTSTGQLTIASNSSTSGTPVISLSGTGTTGTGSAALSALSCSNGAMTGAGTDACTVTLTAAATSGGLTVSLSSNNSAVTVPSTVTVPAGTASAGFTATVASVATAQATILTASQGSSSAGFALLLNAAVPTLSISAASVPFGNVVVNTSATQPVTLTSTGTAPVTINGVTLTGTGFTLSSAALPATLSPGQALTLTVQFDPAATGAATGQLTIASNSSTNGTAMVSLSGTGTPPPLSLLSCSSGAITGAGTDTCTVTLTAAAPSGGLIVNMSSSSSTVTVPSTVTIPAGLASAEFTAKASSVATAQAVTITASVGSMFTSFTLQLNTTILALSINPASVAFGNVVVNTPTTKSITLTSTGTAPVTINGITQTGIGFTFSAPALPITLTPNQATTVDISFDPTARECGHRSTDSFEQLFDKQYGSGQSERHRHSRAGGCRRSNSRHGVRYYRSHSTICSLRHRNVKYSSNLDGVGNGLQRNNLRNDLFDGPIYRPCRSTVSCKCDCYSNQRVGPKQICLSIRDNFAPLPALRTTLPQPQLVATTLKTALSPTTPWLTPNHSVNCGDTIIAAASTAYSGFSFGAGLQWGKVTCPAGNNVAWLICQTFDACKIPTGTAGMTVNASYWGVAGWEVNTVGTGGPCFQEASPSSTIIHHVIFFDDIANGCDAAGFADNNYGTGADYFVVLASIAYDAVQGNAACNEGINVYEPAPSDSLPGTHIYIAGNFSFDNVDPNPCGGGTPTDGEGVSLDTLSAVPYTQQVVADNNIILANGGRGLLVGNNTPAPVYFRHNTVWGNNSGAPFNTNECGEIGLQSATNTQAFLNLAVTNTANVCGSNPPYAFYVSSTTTGDVVYQNWGYSASGYNDLLYETSGFSYGPNNTFGTNPQLANPVAPGAPSCSGYANVPACMAAVIANFTPTNAAAAGYGYQTPSSTAVYDPLFPQWLCNVNLPVGLVTMGCQTAP
jgi:hypothetical protein